MIRSRITFFIAAAFLVFLGTGFATQAAAAEVTPVYFFYGDGCPHCAKEEEFFEDLLDERSDFEVQAFEVWHSEDNSELMLDVAQELDVNVRGVPFTVIGSQAVMGFQSASTTGRSIESLIDQCAGTCKDVVLPIIDPSAQEEQPDTREESAAMINGLPDMINVPFFGEVELSALSLPAATVVIAAVDGFNPCAMWVLVFLIGLLLGMKDRVKRWTLGIAFLIGSAAMYFVFMAAWLELLLFVGFVLWVRVGIGVIALVGGGYSLREWWRTKDGVCRVTDGEKRQRVFDRLKNLVHHRNFLVALIGIVLLAVAVNVVELMCSAGLPAVYTQLLALNDLPSWQYYMYLGLYVLIFLIDDIIVFAVAMLTAELTGISGKYSRYSHLIGGIIMIAIGLMLLLRPEWLMVG